MRKILGVGFLILLLASCSKKVEDSTANIYGTAVDVATQRPIDGVLITLIPGSQSKYTGVDGYFEFTNLMSRQYTISAQKEGYKEDRKSVIVYVGDYKEVVFTLLKLNY